VRCRRDHLCPSCSNWRRRDDGKDVVKAERACAILAQLGEVGRSDRSGEVVSDEAGLAARRRASKDRFHEGRLKQQTRHPRAGSAKFGHFTRPELPRRIVASVSIWVNATDEIFEGKAWILNSIRQHVQEDQQLKGLQFIDQLDLSDDVLLISLRSVDTLDNFER